MVKVHTPPRYFIWDAGPWVFWLLKWRPNLSKRKRLGGWSSALHNEAADIWGLGWQSKSLLHSVFLFYCHKHGDLKPHKFITLQFPWVRNKDTGYLSPLCRVLPGHSQGASWAVVSSGPQAVGRIQFFVVAGLRPHFHAGCQLVASQQF